MEKLSHSIIIPDDPRAATKHLLDKLLSEIYPLSHKIRSMIQEFVEKNGDAFKVNEVYLLSLSQISKCLLNLFDIFRLEYSRCTTLQESRQCNKERLSWCLDRLETIHQYLERNLANQENNDSADNSFNVTTLYFVNWIDHAFENLNNLSDVLYKTGYKETKELYMMWKNEMVECITGTHISIDELLLCAMTLCRYCLPCDQRIIKARCQVVLRETKALLSELIEGDVSATINVTAESLKPHIMPSNTNVTINVLKDVLYALETNTNTALLALLIHCFSSNTSPVEDLKAHFMNGCCCVKSNEVEDEDCPFVKEFDFYNERLLQIGSFAVSCYSDQSIILSVRSGLASLEALDSHVVPAVMTSPDGPHAALLIKTWSSEVRQVRDSVFLIVDPAAFAEKSQQIMHQRLLDALKEESYNSSTVTAVINIGCVVHEFFDVYVQTEPDALTNQEKLLPLLSDLEKAQSECKVVSNLLSTPPEFTYSIKIPSLKTATLAQLYKRLKLLYTLVTRINTVLHPENENDQLFDNEDANNVTHTIAKNGVTYVNSKSLFARTNVRSSTRNFPLSKLTKNLQGRCTELNFSIQLDELFNLSNENMNVMSRTVDKRVDRVRESSVLYNFSPIKNRSSLRKVVLSRHTRSDTKVLENSDGTSVRGSLLNDNESLQLTAVLNEINDITTLLSTPKHRKPHANRDASKNNLANVTISKHIWSIPDNASMVEMAGLPLDECSSNLTQPSNVTTLERITDLDFVEEKLNSLKSQIETSL